MNFLETMNQFMFLCINGGVDTPLWLVKTAASIADYLIALVPLLLLSMWLWGDHAHRSVAVKACLVVLLGLAVNQAIGMLWSHPRPFMMGLGHTWIQHTADSSFPSDHLTVFAGVGLTLFIDGAVALGIATLLVGLVVAWARIFLGVHFPMDMVGAVGVVVIVYVIFTPFWCVSGGVIVELLERIYRGLFGKLIAAGWIRN